MVSSCRARWLWGVVCALGFGALSHAGNLTPPGAPVGTMKTLDEVEPRTPLPVSGPLTITQPGSYYLTGDVVGVAGQHGIRILSNDVTLDLNGFTVRGVPGSLSGIVAGTIMSFRTGVTIRNGVVRDWGASGVLTTEANAVRIEDVHAENNGAWGIRVGGTALVRRCIARGNGQSGFDAVLSTVIVDCVSSSNAGQGFRTDNGCVLVRCVSTANEMAGIVATGTAVVHGANAQGNVADGVVVGVGSVVTGGVMFDNLLFPGSTDGGGVQADAGSVITGVTVRDSGERAIRIVPTAAPAVLGVGGVVTDSVVTGGGGIDLRRGSVLARTTVREGVESRVLRGVVSEVSIFDVTRPGMIGDGPTVIARSMASGMTGNWTAFSVTPVGVSEIGGGLIVDTKASQVSLPYSAAKGMVARSEGFESEVGGMIAGPNSYVLDCLVRDITAGTGFGGLSGGTRFEGNHSIGNFFDGFNVSGAAAPWDMVVRNFSVGNLRDNYDADSLLGGSGGVTTNVNTTNPWANISRP